MFRSFQKLFCLAVLAACLLHCAPGKKKKDNSVAVTTATSGKALFTTHCVSCHALQDDGIGPRLGGVTAVLSEQKLAEFIRNPSSAIESGNQRAVALQRKYRLIMPPFDFLSDGEIKSIISYLSEETRLRSIQPLDVAKNDLAPNNPVQRLITPIAKSGLRIELADFVQIPASSETLPRTRIANIRPHPSGDGTLFVSDQRGVISRISKGEVNTFLDIRPLVENYINEPGLGTGLGSFAFHPDYLNNGLIYITYTEGFKGKRADYEFADSINVAMQWVVSEWKIKDVKRVSFEGSRRELLRVNVPSGVHGMQDIEFEPGLVKSDKDYGMLYIGTGDGGSMIGGHPELAHDLHSLLGTIIRIDPLRRNSKNGNYGIPADNPFVTHSDPEVRKEIFAYGFRNPHRISWDPKHGNIMISAEVGETNFEEVNIIVKGGDYGWNVREGNYGISAKDLKNVFKVDDQNERYIRPFAQYDHVDGNAISGGYVYDGKLEALRDKYIFGDIVSGRLFYININNTLSDSTIHELLIVQAGKPTDLQKLAGSKRVDVRIEYDPFTGEMYILTKNDGKLRKIANAYIEKLP